MVAIKCPNCGSEKCRQLTDEKYLCHACDNEFLIHNLSKEFRQTDEHIKQMHTDLKDIILNSASTSDLDKVYRSAMSLRQRGDVERASEMFLDICDEYAWSYKGWYGRFLCEKEHISKKELVDLISKIKESEDITVEIKKEISQYLEQLKNSLTAEATKNLKDMEQEIETIYLSTEEQLEKSRVEFQNIKSIRQEDTYKKQEELNIKREEKKKLCEEEAVLHKKNDKLQDSLNKLKKQVSCRDKISEVFAKLLTGLLILILVVFLGWWLLGTIKGMFSGIGAFFTGVLVLLFQVAVIAVILKLCYAFGDHVYDFIEFIMELLTGYRIKLKNIHITEDNIKAMQTEINNKQSQVAGIGTRINYLANQIDLNNEFSNEKTERAILSGRKAADKKYRIAQYYYELCQSLDKDKIDTYKKWAEFYDKEF